MLQHFSDWFDTLKEPKRFFTFIIIVFGCYIPFTAFAFLHESFSGIEFIALKILLIIAGFVQVFFLLALALYRAFGK